MNNQRKSVQIYLRVKGPLLPAIKPEFKITGNDTKIRFISGIQSQQQQIKNDFAEIGVYKFEKIFKQNSTQQQIYAKVAQDLVEAAIQGYNGTIFAYGQTGSGKTYTMTGGDDDPSQMGIIPRVIHDLFKEADIRQQQITIKLKYMQIYNKNGYDLLHPDNKSKKLQDLPVVRAMCRGQNFQFQNLSQHDAPNFEEAIKIYQYGDTNRIVCKTPSNDQSSRSHCIFMIGIKTKNRDTGLQQKATINLVDLAGSQRIHYSGMVEQQAKEGININLGLHYLSRVVLALGQQSRANNQLYIPYRDSLLTMALKSSMGGNCKTRMIATINPNPIYNPQNAATCKFSQNLLCMENKLKKNQFINPWDIIKGLKNEVEELKGQIFRLKGQEVKEVLQTQDYIKIRKLVDKFIQSDDPVTSLPISDRLYIREYLTYMKTIIKAKPRAQNIQNKGQNYQTAVSQNFIIQVKNLRQQIQQKQNEIQLFLKLMNDQYKQNPQNIQNNYIPIEQESQKRIAETVLKSLQRNKKMKPITIEEVEKKLLKPIIFNEQQNIDDAFKKFKDSHINSQVIDQREHQIKLKNMKKQVISKKIKNLRLQKTKLNQKIQQIQSKPGNLPALLGLPNKSNETQQLRKDLQDLDEKLKKKYQQLKQIQLEINRLDLCQNKNSKKMKQQFQQYFQSSRNKSQQNINQINKINVEGKDNNKQEEHEKQSKKRLRKKSVASARLKQILNQQRDETQQNKNNISNEQQVKKQMQQFYAARNKILSKS